ncbi:MAG TPA: cytochrome c3 family protein [Methylomirabilota bacterium]|jgi:predicted CXXCH cytochrome family protein|nr:cytochrome c3 family protein [Methylomirabilota bacterium]
MAGPARYSTKVRAKRIALQYFRRLHPFRRWKLILSLLLPALAALWVLVAATRNDQRLYLGGPVSTAHAMFESDCRLCHGPGAPPNVPVTQASLASAAAAAPAGFFLGVADKACTACHDGPRHHDNETFTPKCSTCHLEHLGRAVLVQIADRHCVQCHGALQTKDGKPSPFHPNIPALGQHPEFAVSVRDADKVLRVRLDQPAGQVRDTAQMKLNHTKHLKVNLKGVDDLEKLRPGAVVKVKDGTQVACTFCHTPDGRGQYMQPLGYEKHCAVCHPLDFDGRFADAQVPHTRPAIVHAYLRGTLSDAFDQCQAIPAGDAGKAIRDRCVELELAKAPPAPAADSPRGLRRGAAEPETPPADEPRGGRLRGRAAEPEPAPAPAPDTPRGGRLRNRAEAEEAPPADTPRGGRLRRGGDEDASGGGDTPRGRRGTAAAQAPAAPTSWVATQISTIEPGVFKQRCEFCHTVKREGDALPQIVPPAIPSRWLPHARFDHSPHRSVTCTECHRAPASTETKDVLMPSIATCRDCHQPRVGARTGCVECHNYHDKARERSQDGPFKVHQLLEGIGSGRTDRVR